MHVHMYSVPKLSVDPRGHLEDGAKSLTQAALHAITRLLGIKICYHEQLHLSVLRVYVSGPNLHPGVRLLRFPAII